MYVIINIDAPTINVIFNESTIPATEITKMSEIEVEKRNARIDISIQTIIPVVSAFHRFTTNKNMVSAKGKIISKN
jgi:hypothetical protein